MQNARTLTIVERERESRSLKAIAILACKNIKISLQASKLHIVYWRKKLIYNCYAEKLRSSCMSTFCCL